MPETLALPHKTCQYPGCGADPDRDLCGEHSSRWGRIPRRLRDRDLLPNDGIIDRLAIEVACQGARIVRLTWVERDIAVARMYAAGKTPQEIQERLGFEVSKSRWQKIRDLTGGIRG